MQAVRDACVAKSLPVPALWLCVVETQNMALPHGFDKSFEISLIPALSWACHAWGPGAHWVRRQHGESSQKKSSTPQSPLPRFLVNVVWPDPIKPDRTPPFSGGSL